MIQAGRAKAGVRHIAVSARVVNSQSRAQVHPMYSGAGRGKENPWIILL